MELAEWCSSSRVIIVAGKGGVGKTTIAAALAVAAARAGRRALLVELEGKSGLASMFGLASLTGEQEVYPGVTVLPLAADEALLEYLESHGLRRMSKRLVGTGALDGLTSPDEIRAAAARAGVTLPDGDVDHLAWAARFLTRRRGLQVEQLSRLAERLEVAQVVLPFLFSSDIGRSELEVLADAL